MGAPKPSRVLTDPGVVAEETRERVQRAIEQLEIGRQCVPALTTIRIDARDIGSRTGELLLRLLDGPAKTAAEPPGPIDVGFELVQRETTAPAARARRAGTSRKVTAS